MTGSKKEETNKTMKEECKNGLSAHDLVHAAENELDMNAIPCKYKQFIVITCSSFIV